MIEPTLDQRKQYAATTELFLGQMFDLPEELEIVILEHINVLRDEQKSIEDVRQSLDRWTEQHRKHMRGSRR
jgi:hypothetical protein